MLHVWTFNILWLLKFSCASTLLHHWNTTFAEKNFFLQNRFVIFFSKGVARVEKKNTDKNTWPNGELVWRHKNTWTKLLFKIDACDVICRIRSLNFKGQDSVRLLMCDVIFGPPFSPFHLENQSQNPQNFLGKFVRFFVTLGLKTWDYNN